jgi:nuclear transport factor 2 (NTF2) superfamily protein
MKTAKFPKNKIASTTMSSTIRSPGLSSIGASHPEANVVQIAGDFNDWQPGKTPMTKAGDGTWQARVPLAKGTYRYRLVVDGKWQHDPHNDSTEVNPYGELNSVIRVS